MVRQGPLSVLAFAIRYREIPAGRAPVEPRLSVVDGLATTEASRISELPSMAKTLDEFDSGFSPCRRAGTPADEWAVIATTVAAALFIAGLALAQSMGDL